MVITRLTGVTINQCSVLEMVIHGITQIQKLNFVRNTENVAQLGMFFDNTK